MAGGCAWSRRVGARARTLRGLVRDTQRALHDVADILSVDSEISSIVSEIGHQAIRPTALVVLGSSARAKVRLLHALIGTQLLPDDLPRGCRWIRIQYGSTTQVHLSLGNSEFELVEELQCNTRPWDVLPVEDLLRQESTDLTTILEVEINNQFLKDGLRIIIPPDIPSDPGSLNHLQLKSLHSELYAKRSSILKSFNPVYFYAIDRLGKNIFSDNICGNMVVSRSDEDFWSTFNLYDMNKSSSVEVKCGRCEDTVVWSEGRGEQAVFNSENCLDLHQAKETNPYSQFLFILFSDAQELETISSTVHVDAEATESTEKASYWSGELPESDQGLIRDGNLRNTSESPGPKPCDNERLNEEQTAFMNELIDQWELMTSPPLKHHVKSQWAILDTTSLGTAAQNKSKESAKTKRENKYLKTRTALLNITLKFATDCMQTYLLECSTRLSEVHVKLLQQFILASFDMARELQVVPKKIQYVARQERHLYDTINEKFANGDKKQELVQMMQEVLQEIKVDVENMDWSVDGNAHWWDSDTIENLPCHQDQRFLVSNSTFYNSCRNSVSLPHSPSHSITPSPSNRLSPSLALSEIDEPSDGEEASCETCCLDEYDIIVSNEESYSDYFTRSKQEEESPSPANDIRVENEETSVFSLSHATRGLWAERSDVTTCTSNVSVQHATLDVQRTVLSRLSRKISLKLVKFVDCLKENYFGTLQRCLESLESSCRRELGGRPASEAMRQLLSVGRQVELQPCAAFSAMRSLLDSLRRLFYKFSAPGAPCEGRACCRLAGAWRRQAALHAVSALSKHRLARIISTQILERLSMAHEKYQSALTSLETALASRLHHTEDIKLAIRKKHAPTFARLCLESTSMCDLLMYGTPDLGREIGRGQYGVVHAARGGWAGRAPAAVKVVLPADERHYHELAMEFFYTRSIPPHPRVVRLLGSVVQRAGAGRSVLLVSQRAVRDLHAAVRAGLPRSARMRVALDIIQGIRYLHSLGLVHRDIKLKNVLLDAQNRASLSDLGFCSYGPLMSGSVVGTPVHMAPELFNGDYSAMVDVYAFGILFWYLCAGDVKLPAAFEAFHNKEQLWSKVKKGLRPERLPQFTDECWEVMEECWHQEPSQRALPGDLQPRLQKILQEAAQDTQPYHRHNSEDDSLNMTGVYD